MKHALLIAILGLGLPSLSHADLSGPWSGTADYAGDDGTTFVGVPMMLSFEVAADKVTFHENFWDDTLEFGLAGTDLTLDGAVVGEWTAEKFFVKIADPGYEGCTQEYSFDATGAYLDNYYCDDGYFDRVEGKLAAGAGDGTFRAKLSRRR